MRMLCLRAALTDFLRRWGIYLTIVVVLFSAGSNAPVRIALALAGLLVWPLRFAAAHGLVLVPMTLAYAVVGTLPVVLTRPLWWPRQWAAAEHALPLAVDAIRRSDRLFAVLTMVPWQALLLIGGIGAWLAEAGADAGAERWWAFAGWAASAAGSLQISLLWMRVVRRRAVATGTTPARTLRHRGPARPRTPIRPLDARRALVLVPVTRGIARRSLLALTAGSSAAVAGAVAPQAVGLAIGWTFAFAALAVLCATSVLRTGTLLELRPLWQDQPHLPLDAQACERARLTVTLLPLIAGGVACLVVATIGATPLRPQVCALYGVVVVAGCVFEALTPPTMSPSDHAARWMLTLVAALAFASEISPA